MEKQIIEINGVKLEVDLSTAKVVSNYKVGDKVKILIQDGYGAGYNCYPGIIIGFETFKSHPTLVIAYLKTTYNEADIKFLYYNDTVENCEITHCITNDIPFEKSNVLTNFDKLITKAETELEVLKNKKEYFLKNFGKYFEN